MTREGEGAEVALSVPQVIVLVIMVEFPYSNCDRYLDDHCSY
jgi:hypothetical protein